MARRSRIRLHVSPALVVAAIALAVSLGGTGYAAMKLPKNSVGAPQLKKNAVNSAKVKDASLLAVDFATGQLPAGPPGSKGDKGDQGAPGPAGAQGPPGLSDLQYVEVVGATNLTNPREVQAICPAGKRVVGGGHALSNNAKSAGTIAESRPCSIFSAGLQPRGGPRASSRRTGRSSHTPSVLGSAHEALGGA